MAIMQSVRKIKDAKRRKETIAKYQKSFAKCWETYKKVERRCNDLKKSIRDSGSDKCNKPSACEGAFDLSMK
jgi:hypothetical protein